MSDTLLLISDVHMDEWADDLPDAYQEKQRVFREFLQWVAAAGHAGKVGRFCVAGDPFDVPQRDREPLLPRYQEVLAGIRDIMEAGVKVSYVIGNHDAGLVGLSVKQSDPSLVITYPYLLAESAGRTFVIEHGHLQDPWLWDYVRQLAQAMWTDSAPPSGPPMALAATDSAPAAERSMMAVDQNAVWQASLQGGVTTDALPGLTDLLTQDLQEDYSDVTDPQHDAGLIRTRDRTRDVLSGSTPGAASPSLLAMTFPPEVENLVQVYYSSPHWRRAARRRLAELSEQLGIPLAGIIMGHTHYSDTFTWGDAEGNHQYVNAGSWRRDHADFVLVDNGTAQLFCRKWDEQLPVL